MRKIIRQSLISIGVVLLAILFITDYIDTRSIIETFINISLNTIVEFGKIESMVSILGFVFIIIGLLIKPQLEENIKVENPKKLQIRYKILRWLGILPFIAILGIGVFSSINGFSFMFSTSYGISAFFESMFIISLLIWPLYIIGIILIIYTTQKLTNLNK